MPTLPSISDGRTTSGGRRGTRNDNAIVVCASWFFKTARTPSRRRCFGPTLRRRVLAEISWDKSGFKASGTRWVHTNKDDAANPFIRARLVAQETKRGSELTSEDASSTFAATPPVKSLKFMLSRCMTGKRPTLAEEKALGPYDISRAQYHSLARRTIAIKVSREDDECTSGYAVLDEAV